jgi:hypothetical protein
MRAIRELLANTDTAEPTSLIIEQRHFEAALTDRLD